MEALKRVESDFFQELGLEVTHGDVEVGKTYPIFGMITKLIDDEPGHFVSQINYNIISTMNIPDREKVEVLKERAFEAGIFFSTVTSKAPQISVDCQTVIFGRKQGYNA